MRLSSLMQSTLLKMKLSNIIIIIINQIILYIIDIRKYSAYLPQPIIKLEPAGFQRASANHKCTVLLCLNVQSYLKVVNVRNLIITWFFHSFSDPARIVNGTALPGVDETPDFRFEEEPWLAHWWKFYKEQRRPYRMSPHYKQSYRWNYWTTYWGSNVVSIYVY